jgi:hypothetical protein
MIWPIYIAFFALQIATTFPRFSATCAPTARDRPTTALYFLHHLLDVFLFWSPAFLTSRAEFIAHAAATLAVGAHWIANKNRCIATEVMNRRCGYADEEWLDSLKNRLGLRATVGEYFQFAWLGALLAYDAWRIMRG